MAGRLLQVAAFEAGEQQRMLVRLRATVLLRRYRDRGQQRGPLVLSRRRRLNLRRALRQFAGQGGRP